MFFVFLFSGTLLPRSRFTTGHGVWILNPEPTSQCGMMRVGFGALDIQNVLKIHVHLNVEYETRNANSSCGQMAANIGTADLSIG